MYYFLDTNTFQVNSTSKFIEDVKDMAMIIDKHTNSKNKNIFFSPKKLSI